MKDNLEIQELIIKFLNNDISQEEIEILNNWVTSSDENKDFFHRIKNYFEASQKPSSKIDVNKALNKVNKQINKYERKPIAVWTVLQRIAAIFFIPLITLSTYLYLRNTAEEPINYHNIRANIGSCLTVNLPDGTEAWLNSGSSLRYPDNFTGGTRKVFLEGEGYFEVESSVSQPFIVITSTLQTVATGTKFVVADYENDPIKEVALIEGKLSVNTSKSPHRKIAVLEPNNHLTYNSDTKSTDIFKGDIYKYYAWKDDKLVFRNDAMIDVIRKISQRYNVNIELRDKDLYEYKYWASFGSETLDEILELLKISSPIDYYKEPRVQLRDGSFSEPKVVIYKRKTKK